MAVSFAYGNVWGRRSVPSAAFQRFKPGSSVVTSPEESEEPRCRSLAPSASYVAFGQKRLSPNRPLHESCDWLKAR